MDWTPSQKEAIDYRGENILLSAAAGSGKTAVLVQRVIEMILDEENPISVNELLILTFTEAAATEMKRKIAAAINEEFLKNPQSAHLKKQRILINSANISTIHAFCLEVIKGNINNTDIPVDFSIISTIENKIMTEQALNLVLTRFYENIDYLPSFKKLVLSHGSDKGDGNLRTIILSLLNFAQSMAHPAKWLNSSAAAYKSDDFLSSVWHDRLFDYAEKELENIAEVYDEICRVAEPELPADHPYLPFFREEKSEVSKIAEAIKDKNYEKAHSLFSEFEFRRIPAKRSKEPKEAIAQGNVKAFRDLAKKNLLDLSSFFIASAEQIALQLKENEPQIRTLKNIVLMTMRAHKKMKRMAGYIDFNDLEHEMIALLEGKDNAPSSVAISLQKRFREILIDEYQDTNNAQDTIFSLVSRDNSNIFTVGDIKQCIYKFRNAVPEIFAEKAVRYREKSGGHLIRLAQNFRSRQEVLDFTNFVFERIMTDKACGINYGEEERLEFGASYYPDAENPENYLPEFNIIDGRNLEDSSGAEAAAIAERIRKMIDSGLLITDPKTKEVRPVRYSDIVILLRNTKNTANIFEKVFANKGIPVYSETGQSYLTSIEVQTVLSYLEIINNPYQDIPLIAVLRSPLWRFTPDMLAKIRSTGGRRCAFYDAMKTMADNGDASCARFISELESLRFEAEYLSISDLVLVICNRYNYKEIVSGEADGQIKAENLRLLFERAAEYDATQNSSLFGFMLYIQTILDADMDFTPAKIDGENSDTVKIISIHKSKGLEFPVVILANTFARFNASDTTKSILWHDQFGFGLPYTDTQKRIKYPSIPHKLISKTLMRELIAEEMRILYVAMTRAKEKLIISAIIKKQSSAWSSPYLAQDGLLTAGILSARSIGDWVSFALARYNGAGELQNEHKLAYTPSVSGKDLVKVSLREAEFGGEEETEIAFTAKYVGEELDPELMDKLRNDYSNSEAIPLKMSVSEAKRRQSEEEFYSPHIFTVPTVSAVDISMISATDRGTITHFVLQHINPHKANTEQEVLSEVADMVSRGLISAVQRDAVDIKSIAAFFQSELGKRLKDAKEVRKEFNFYTETDASEFYPEQKGNKILLQGTMDCFFREENGNVVLLDYKTDRIDENQILKRSQKYYHQLKYYKQGIESILGHEVSEAYIYFLSCQKAVSIEDAKNDSV